MIDSFNSFNFETTDPENLETLLTAASEILTPEFVETKANLIPPLLVALRDRVLVHINQNRTNPKFSRTYMWEEFLEEWEDFLEEGEELTEEDFFDEDGALKRSGLDQNTYSFQLYSLLDVQGTAAVTQVLPSPQALVQGSPESQSQVAPEGQASQQSETNNELQSVPITPSSTKAEIPVIPKKSKTTLIVGAAVGVAVSLLFGGWLVYWFFRRRK